MKKGFTLVELAIVLVVIGLLLGMAFKGKTLVDAARVKAEVNKVEKLGTAVTTYYSKYDVLPGVRTSGVTLPDGTTAADNSSAAIYGALLKEGMLKDSDFKSTTGGTYWIFIGCTQANGTWTEAAIAENNNLCIYRSSSEPKTYKTAVQAVSTPFTSGVSICQIETLLDDKNLSAGDGRLKGAPANGVVDNASWNCADTNKYSTANSAITYLYRIF